MKKASYKTWPSLKDLSYENKYGILVLGSMQRIQFMITGCQVFWFLNTRRLYLGAPPEKIERGLTSWGWKSLQRNNLNGYVKYCVMQRTHNLLLWLFEKKNTLEPLLTLEGSMKSLLFENFFIGLMNKIQPVHISFFLTWSLFKFSQMN